MNGIPSSSALLPATASSKASMWRTTFSTSTSWASPGTPDLASRDRIASSSSAAEPVFSPQNSRASWSTARGLRAGQRVERAGSPPFSSLPVWVGIFASEPSTPSEALFFGVFGRTVTCASPSVPSDRPSGPKSLIISGFGRFGRFGRSLSPSFLAILIYGCGYDSYLGRR